MRNADQPAMPISEEIWVDPKNTSRGTHLPLGLTKLEHFAGLAMQGFLSNRLEVPSTEGRTLCQFIAVCSVDYAKALLDELEKKT